MGNPPEARANGDRRRRLQRHPRVSQGREAQADITGQVRLIFSAIVGDINHISAMTSHITSATKTRHARHARQVPRAAPEGVRPVIVPPAAPAPPAPTPSPGFRGLSLTPPKLGLGRGALFSCETSAP